MRMRAHAHGSISFFMQKPILTCGQSVPKVSWRSDEWCNARRKKKMLNKNVLFKTLVNHNSCLNKQIYTNVIALYSALQQLSNDTKHGITCIVNFQFEVRMRTRRCAAVFFSPSYHSWHQSKHSPKFRGDRMNGVVTHKGHTHTHTHTHTHSHIHSFLYIQIRNSKL